MQRPRVALYCRLSDEDRHKKTPEAESESIQNQKNMLTAYAIEQNWDIYMLYCDESYSGADADRPAYNQLLRDAEEKKFDIVLCKTQSRFTRDNVHLDIYIHGRFVEWGIRFISLVDHADTAIKGNKKARQITGLMNEWQLEDMSDNVRAVLEVKKRDGKFVGAFAPYGFLKDPGDKNRLVIDPVVVPIIRRIFDLRRSGESLRSIAEGLNREKIPCPMQYKQEVLKSAFRSGDTGMQAYRWTDATVRRILKNRAYTGAVVQHKSHTVSYKNQRIIRRPRSEWIVVENTHEAIVDSHVFEQINNAVQARQRPARCGVPPKFSGKLRCGVCGGNMVVQTKRPDKRYYRCAVALRDKGACTGSHIAETLLENHVRQALEEIMQEFASPEAVAEAAAEIMLPEKRKVSEIKTVKKQIARHKKTLSEREKALVNLYIDKSKGIVTKDQFIRISRAIREETELLNAEILRCEGLLSNDGKWMKWTAGSGRQTEEEAEKHRWVEAYLHADELTREMVVELIEYICVRCPEKQEQKQIEIHWDF